MTKQQDKATARPWRQDENPLMVVDATGEQVAFCGVDLKRGTDLIKAHAKANTHAALIVKAVNAHDVLTAALRLSFRNVTALIDMHPVGGDAVDLKSLTAWLDSIRAALKLAEPEGDA